MNRFASLTAALSLFVFALAGCELPEDETADEVIGIDDLEISIDEALDDEGMQDELADEVEAPADDLLDDLDVDEADEDLDRPSRRAVVKRIVRRLAEEEECALRGVLGGRYAETDQTDADVDADGVFRGRAFRRHRRLVAVGQGVWNNHDAAPGGTFQGRYESFEGNIGLIDGAYTPHDPADLDRLGSFRGTWTPEDGSHEGGNIGGVWHPTRDGRGVFVGYWSRCDEAPIHDVTEAS